MCRSRARQLVIGLAAAALAACSEAAGPAGTAELAFEPAAIQLDTLRHAGAVIRNVGTLPVGPITLAAGSVRDDAGQPVAGPALTVAPDDIATLNPGQERVIDLVIVGADGLPAGQYRVQLEAQVQAAVCASIAVDFRIADPPSNGLGNTLTIVTGPLDVRQGDVASYRAEVRDSTGAVVVGAPIQWSIAPNTAGLLLSDGRMVGYSAGAAQVIARSGGVADTVTVTIADRSLSGSLSMVGHGSVRQRFTSDLWVRNGVAYTGTWGGRTRNDTTRFGNALLAWDVSDPAQPVLTDSVIVDARVVNDVKIRSDGSLAVITHESASDARNGVTLLGLTDPLHPTVITRFTSTLETGVHNAWIEGDYVYLVVDGSSPTSGLRVLDISDPQNPQIVAGFYAGFSFLHDVYVRDGLAFLSHWNAGLVILDVGNGIAGGAPTNPVEVSRQPTEGGQTHNAWYWPDAGYVFVGEEDFGTPGRMHVVNVQDLRAPREVATFRVPGTTPHNFWLDEANGVLYLAWYDNGVRMLDVTGDLLGELDRQGREIVGLQYGAGVGCPSSSGTGTCTWAPQLEGDLLYVSDMNTGLWVFRPSF
jgi:hypothetical protein